MLLCAHDWKSFKEGKQTAGKVKVQVVTFNVWSGLTCSRTFFFKLLDVRHYRSDKLVCLTVVVRRVSCPFISYSCIRNFPLKMHEFLTSRFFLFNPPLYYLFQLILSSFCFFLSSFLTATLCIQIQLSNRHQRRHIRHFWDLFFFWRLKWERKMDRKAEHK